MEVIATNIGDMMLKKEEYFEIITQVIKRIMSKKVEEENK